MFFGPQNPHSFKAENEVPYISEAQNPPGIVLLPPCTARPSQFLFR